ncbi:hypothetical protein K8640_12285 [Myxococcus sp. XM-1-1-1]|nr:hypothetical protein [Myxococcus sp. XM-1-1-1]MBZ4408996.1 hypothetical protein [Myxococcus sp. XM-1-1-1]
MASCPREWTRDATSNEHGTLETCTAASGPHSCYRDFDCRGACFCP